MKLTSIAIAITALLLHAGQTAAQTAETLYNEGVSLKDSKKSQEAIDKFKKAVSLKPDYTAAFYEMGWCQNDTKDYIGAIISLRKARLGWPAVPKVYFELGYAFDKTGKKDSAISMYNRCLELKPDYSLAHKQLGYIDYVDENYKSALSRFASYESAAKAEIKDYLYWYRKGFSCNATKDFTTAKYSLLKSLEFKKDYLNTYLELGFAYSRLKQNDEAISYYKKAMEVDPKSHVPYNGIGEVYRDNIKDRDEAMVWYRKTLEMNPKERKALFGVGYCLNSQGKYGEAIPYLQKAIDNESTYTAAYVELGYSYYMSGRHSDAIEKFNKAISINPENENARYYSTLVYVKQNNKTMAQKMVNELKSMSSKYVAELQKKVDAM